MITGSHIGVRGIISNGRGLETPVTFSLYPNSDETADGFCRVSDESNVLYELFNSGKHMRLCGDKLDVMIVLTSEGTFRVIDGNH